MEPAQEFVTVPITGDPDDDDVNIESHSNLIHHPMMSENQNFSSSEEVSFGVVSQDHQYTVSTVSIVPQLIEPETPPSFVPFEIPGLGGATEDLLLSKIFIYLTAKDLCVLSQCSRYFRDTTSAAKVWNSLYMRDFFYHDVSFTTGSSRRTHSPVSMIGSRYSPVASNQRLSSFLSSMQPSSSSLSNADITKFHYVRQYKGMKLRHDQKKAYNQSFQRSIDSEKVKQRAEQFLEITQLRIMIPLPFAAAFISLLLVGLKYSGYTISIWYCATPLLFYLVYLLACGIVAWYVRRNEFEHSSVCYGLWPMFQGPVKLCFPSGTDSSARVTALLVIVTFLCTLEVLLIALKMSLSPQPGGTQSYPTPVNLSWGVAFVPLWVVFFLYCLLPVSGVLRAGSGYDGWLAGLILVWVPFFIFTVCLVVKLGYEETGNDDKADKIRLALVLMPFWVFEGVILLSSLCFLLDGCLRCVLNRRPFLLLFCPFLFYKPLIVLIGCCVGIWTDWMSILVCFLHAGVFARRSSFSRRCCRPTTTSTSTATTTASAVFRQWCRCCCLSAGY